MARIATAVVAVAILVGAGVAIGGSVAAQTRRPHIVTVATASPDMTAALESSHAGDARAENSCRAWVAPGGGGPAGSAVLAAQDSTASDVRALLEQNRKNAAQDVNLIRLGSADYVAVCVFDISGASGFGGASRLIAYATPENDGVGLVALD